MLFDFNNNFNQFDLKKVKSVSELWKERKKDNFWVFFLSGFSCFIFLISVITSILFLLNANNSEESIFNALKEKLKTLEEQKIKDVSNYLVNSLNTIGIFIVVFSFIFIFYFVKGVKSSYDNQNFSYLSSSPIYFSFFYISLIVWLLFIFLNKNNVTNLKLIELLNSIELLKWSLISAGVVLSIMIFYSFLYFFQYIKIKNKFLEATKYEALNKQQELMKQMFSSISEGNFYGPFSNNSTANNFYTPNPDKKEVEVKDLEYEHDIEKQKETLNKEIQEIDEQAKLAKMNNKKENIKTSKNYLKLDSLSMDKLHKIADKLNISSYEEMNREELILIILRLTDKEDDK